MRHKPVDEIDAELIILAASLARAGNRCNPGLTLVLPAWFGWLVPSTVSTRAAQR